MFLDTIKTIDNFSLFIITIGILIFLYLKWYFEMKKIEKQNETIKKLIQDILSQEMKKIINWLEQDTNHPCMTINMQLKNQKWREEIKSALNDFKNKMEKLGAQNSEISLLLEKIMLLVERKL